MNYAQMNLSQLNKQTSRLKKRLEAAKGKVTLVQLLTLHLEAINDVVKSRTTKAFRCALPKKQQRALGLIPQIPPLA